MTAFPFIHVSFALAGEAERRGWDAFVRDVFAPVTMYEVLTTPDAERLGLHRHQTLLAIGNTVVYAAAPAGAGLSTDSAIGNMLRALASQNAWIGIAIGVADLDTARAWVRERGWLSQSYPLLEDRYFLLDRSETLGMRLEFLAGALDNDPRLKAGWDPLWWRDAHPLGLEGLQSIGVSTGSLAAARAIFGEKLGWREIATRTLPEARCASFLVGDAVVEAMEPVDPQSPLADHARAVRGIWCLTFQVRSASAAAACLAAKGFALIGDRDRRFAIDPAQAFGRLLWFTDERVAGYPPIPIPHRVDRFAQLA
ncbi:MAG: VOC family protein [Novosphingobium sp.]|nr:VOC family protein [Novosphingobium sp.]